MVIPCTYNCVVESESWLRFTSTRRPKFCRKSAPRIGCLTSAIANGQRKVLRSPRIQCEGTCTKRINLIVVYCLYTSSDVNIQHEKEEEHSLLHPYQQENENQ